MCSQACGIAIEHAHARSLFQKARRRRRADPARAAGDQDALVFHPHEPSHESSGKTLLSGSGFVIRRPIAHVILSEDWSLRPSAKTNRSEGSVHSSSGSACFRAFFRFFRPYGACSFLLGCAYPPLARWAAFLRSFGAWVVTLRDSDLTFASSALRLIAARFTLAEGLRLTSVGVGFVGFGGAALRPGTSGPPGQPGAAVLQDLCLQDLDGRMRPSLYGLGRVGCISVCGGGVGWGC